MRGNALSKGANEITTPQEQIGPSSNWKERGGGNDVSCPWVRNLPLTERIIAQKKQKKGRRE